MNCCGKQNNNYNKYYHNYKIKKKYRERMSYMFRRI